MGVGVKQGCVMAPVIFNVVPAAASCLYRESFPPERAVELTYRLDGSVFNLTRLKARTKVSKDFITELQYADDCALVADSPEGLQSSIIGLNDIYKGLGLVIDTDKIEVLYQWYESLPPGPQQSVVSTPCSRTQISSATLTRY